MILIISIKDDLHAINVRNELKRKGYTDCYILEGDHLFSETSVHWHTKQKNETSFIKLSDGKIININSIELIWWRRVRADQKLDDIISDHYQKNLINNDCRGALNGILETNFNGKWLSDPIATDKASNKIYQLSIAGKCGFRIPETLVSQSKEEVEKFTDELKGQVIVKPVVGTAGPLMFTKFVGNITHIHANSFKICPAIYQEFIEGTRHIRLNCFGNKSYAATIESTELDWRPNLNVPVSNWDVPPSLHKKVRLVLDELGLEMGIIDIKETPGGEYVWLEVNPQGQFLFLEPLTNVPLTSYFADYLMSNVSSLYVRQ